MENYSGLSKAVVGLGALFGLLVALYVLTAIISGGTPQAAPVHTAPPAAGGGSDSGQAVVTGPTATRDLNDPRSALGALAVALADPAVAQWQSGHGSASVAGISSDFCQDGLSDTWNIVLTSPAGQVMICVDKGQVAQLVDLSRANQVGVDPQEVIDSDRAWNTAAADLEARGCANPSSVSMALKSVAGGPVWDLNCHIGDDYRITRVDALNGSVLRSVSMRQG